MSSLDCQKCGACCIGQLVLVIHGDNIPLHMTDGGPLPSMRVDDYGRCIALRGRLGVNVTCAIYGQRPQICKALKIGSQVCKESRRRWYLSD